MGKKFRSNKVKWTIDEVPVMWTRPKKYIFDRDLCRYVYDCEKCGEEFETDYQIHIPWCEDCRLKSINTFVKRQVK